MFGICTTINYNTHLIYVFLDLSRKAFQNNIQFL